MRYLLDVNVLIALIDERHTLHDAAHDWFASHSRLSWATCPIVENGCVRVMMGRSYSPAPANPRDVAFTLADLRRRADHVFWPDDVSLLDSALIDAGRLRTSGQVTDSYLLALAVSKGATLATLDRRLSPAAVRGGAEALHVIGET